MTSEVVKYAPKAVIDELDAVSFEILTLGEVLRDIENARGEYWYLNETNKWFKSFPFEEQNEIQYEVAKHLVGERRLQPERETRYYVEFEDNYGKPGVVFSGDRAVDVSFLPRPVAYELGLDHETAVKAQALYGGTIEEIK